MAGRFLSVCLALFLGWTALGADPALTRVVDVRKLGADEADRGLPAKLTGMVTANDRGQGLFFIADETGPIFVELADKSIDAAAGDWVEVQGVTGAGRFSRILFGQNIKKVPARTAIPPAVLPLAGLTDPMNDARLVTISGVVRSVSPLGAKDSLYLITDGTNQCSLIVPKGTSAQDVAALVDSRVTVTGIAILRGQNSRVASAELAVRSANDLRLVSGPRQAASVPFTKISEIRAGGPGGSGPNRVRLHGYVTHVEPGKAYFQDETGALLLLTQVPLAPGNEIDVLGFVDWTDGFPRVVGASTRLGTAKRTELPLAISPSQMFSGKVDFSLVAMRATVVQHWSQENAEELTCRDGRVAFVARLKNSTGNALSAFPANSEVELTGIVYPRFIPGEATRDIVLLLRTTSDVRILEAAPWWTVGLMSKIILALGGIILLAICWILVLRIQVNTQTELISSQFAKEMQLEAQYGDLVKNANDMIYTVGLDGRFTGVNDSGPRLLGYRVDEMLNKSFEEVLTPESATLARRVFQEKLEKGGRSTYEVVGLHKLGRRVDLEISSWVVSRDGKPVAVQGIARDVSARKLTEHALRESEEKYRDVVETSHDLIWAVDAAGRWRFLNKAALRIYGFEPDALLGHKVGEREAPSESGNFEKMIEASRGRETVRLETAHFKSDGSTVYLWFEATVLRDHAGEPAGLRGTARDITQQKRDHENVLRLAAAVEQSAEIVAILTPCGRIEYLNPAFQRITGLSPAQMAGSDFAALLLTRPGLPSFLEIAEVVARSGIWSGRLFAMRGDKSVFEAETRISSIHDAHGHVINYACLLRDVTREADLEEQVRLSQKMEAIGLLAGGVAHDFNNLVQVIDGYARLAMNSLADVAVCRENLERVLQGTQRAAQLTRQLLAFGHRQTMQMGDVDLNDLVAEHLLMIKRLIGSHIEVEFFPANAVHNVRVDRGQIEQVLLNLCINSRDAMPHGGRIEVEVSNQSVDAAAIPAGSQAEPGDYVALSVKDNGSGIEKDIMAKIFDPFFTTKPKGKGTGLGLSVVYGIVRQHHGFITVRSSPGEGAEFRVHFPFVAPLPPGPADKAVGAVTTGQETILLAEDEPLVREIAMRVLTGAGYTVIAAENGAEAIELFEKNQSEIGLLVFDVLMPRMNGTAAYLKIRELAPDIPAILCTGYAGTDPLLDSLVAAGMEVLSKPYSADLFLIRIRQTIDHFQPLRFDEVRPGAPV